MDEIIRMIQAIDNTLGTIKTDDSDGNWSKLLGCRTACKNLIAALTKRKEESENGDPD